MNQERYEILMVRVVDGVATPAEREELMAHVSQDPALQRELESHLAVKAVTDGWVARLMVDLAQDRATSRPSHRLAVGVALGVFAMSVLTLMGWGLAQLFLDPEVPVAVQAGISGLILSAIVLLGVVVRERLLTRKHDQYTEVIR